MKLTVIGQDAETGAMLLRDDDDLVAEIPVAEVFEHLDVLDQLRRAVPAGSARDAVVYLSRRLLARVGVALGRVPAPRARSRKRR